MKQGSNIGNIFKSKRRSAEEEREILADLRDKNEFDKKDLLALIIAGLTTILPVVVVILLLYYFISMFVFG